jgi:hypothetical protein
MALQHSAAFTSVDDRHVSVILQRMKGGKSEQVLRKKAVELPRPYASVRRLQREVPGARELQQRAAGSTPQGHKSKFPVTI